MSATLGRAFLHNFLGQAPAWYKYTIIAFLAVNPLIGRRRVAAAGAVHLYSGHGTEVLSAPAGRPARH